jgi:PAS domain S-box-containing protein
MKGPAMKKGSVYSASAAETVIDTISSRFKLFISGQLIYLVILSVALFGVFLTSYYNYLLFHTIAEIFSVVVAYTIFVLTWKSQRFLNNGYLLFIGISFFFIANIDIVHTLSYKGMGVFPDHDANLPTQLWIAARYLQSISLAAAFLFLSRTVRPVYIFTGFSLVSILIFASIFTWNIFPISFIEGVGLTPFKIYSEYIISLILLAVLFLLHKNRAEFEGRVRNYLSVAVLVGIASELAFTEYVGVYDAANMMGHLFKIVSFYFIYKAIIETGFDRPYDLMFRTLKQNEEALKKSEARARRLFDSNIIGVAYADKFGAVLSANKAFFHILGADPDDSDLEQLNWLELTPSEYKPQDEQAIAESIRTGACTPYEKEYIRKDGSRAPVLFGFAFMESSQTDLVCFALDLAEQKEAQESLSRIEWLLTKSIHPKQFSERNPIKPAQKYGNLSEQNRSRVLLDAVGEHVLHDVVSDFLDLLDTSAAVFERNGDYALWVFSSGWCRMLNQASRDSCKTDNNQEALDSGNWSCHEACWSQAAKLCMGTGQPLDIECWGGLNIYAVPVFASQKVVGALSVGYGDPPKERDRLEAIAAKTGLSVDVLTQAAYSYESRPPYMIELAKNRLVVSARLLGEIVERKQAEAEVQNYATRLELINQELKDFAYLASHDLQEPLRKIQAFSSRIQDKYVSFLDEEGQDYLRRMTSAAFRMQEMIEGLLDYSKLTLLAKPFEQVDLNLAAEEVLSDLEIRIEKCKGKVELVNLPVLEADPFQMRRLLQNLIANGLKFYKPGVPPLVRVIAETKSNEDASHEGWVILSVSDNGIGFDENLKHRLFQPFQRLVRKAEYEGSGVGLAICRKIVERHGGTINVNSVPGMGTTFVVKLPVSQKPGSVISD